MDAYASGKVITKEIEMKGYRTLIIGAVIAALGFLQQFAWDTLIPEHWTGFVVAGIGALMMYMRKISDTPVGESK